MILLSWSRPSHFILAASDARDAGANQIAACYKAELSARNLPCALFQWKPKNPLHPRQAAIQSHWCMQSKPRSLRRKQIPSALFARGAVDQIPRPPCHHEIPGPPSQQRPAATHHKARAHPAAPCQRAPSLSMSRSPSEPSTPNCATRPNRTKQSSGRGCCGCTSRARRTRRRSLRRSAWWCQAPADIRDRPS